MEQTIISLLSGELGVSTLLLLFIIGLLTKRFVPWWVYDALVEELNMYKKEAPALLEEVRELLTMLDPDQEGEEEDDTRHGNTLQRRSRTRTNSHRKKKQHE